MDIVERLRGNADERLAGWQIVVIMHEAADEIERLRKALNDIAKLGPDGELWNTKAEIWMIAEAALKGDE